jgi:hypothetical protein
MKRETIGQFSDELAALSVLQPIAHRPSLEINPFK